MVKKGFFEVSLTDGMEVVQLNCSIKGKRLLGRCRHILLAKAGVVVISCQELSGLAWPSLLL